jgi:hypothetical protein
MRRRAEFEILPVRDREPLADFPKTKAHFAPLLWRTDKCSGSLQRAEEKRMPASDFHAEILG